MLKLYGNMPLMEPLESREVKKIREFVIAIDTSYSTSGTLVEQFLKETFSILTQKNSFFAQSKIRVIQCDNQIRSDVELKSERDIAALMQEFTFAGRRKHRFPAGVFIYQRSDRAWGTEKSRRAFVFYGWQGGLSENKTGVSDGIFGF